MDLIPLIILSVILVAVVVVTLLSLQGLFALFITKVPYVPTSNKIVDRVIHYLDIQESHVAYDLGAGDGRFIAAARKRGASVKGYELRYWLTLFMRWRFRKNTNVEIYRENFFNADISDADIIFCYLFPEIMKKLELKVQNELKSGARIASYSFPFPNLEPDDVIEIPKRRGVDKIYIYRM